MNMIKSRLKDLLDDNNIKPENLSTELKLARTKVYDWLKGRETPNFSNIIKLANYFNCSIDYLVGRSEDNSEMKFHACPPFSERLHSVMKEQKVTQYKMIKEGIVSGGHFNSWFKKGSQPSLDSLIRLADYFNVSIDYLIGRE